MKIRLLAIVLASICMLPMFSVRAQVPQLINYQGRVLAGSTNFNGTGQFKFALVDLGASTTFWSNDGTSSGGSEPTSAVSLSVSNGLYSVLLGDTTIPNMTVAIPFSAFTNSDVRLRVWFNDGSHGSQLLSPDQRIAAVGYAMIAVTAVTVPASSITGALAVTHGGTGSTTAGGALTNLGGAATSGNLSQFASTTSTQLAGVISDETGTGSLVLANSPTIASPTINSANINSPNITTPTISTPTITGLTTLQGNNLNVGGDANFILARSSNTTGAGAPFFILGQHAGGTDQNGGALVLNAGLATGTGQDGNISIGSASTSSVSITPTTAIAGTLHLSTGTAAAPSYTFTSDLNTGMYRSAADTIDFATGGVSRMSIGNTTITATNPIAANAGVKIGSTGDTMTFFKRVDANLDFPNTPSSTCSNLPVTVTGAQLGDVALLGQDGNICNGFFTVFVSAADTVTVAFNNPTGVALDPGARFFRIVVIR